MKTNLVESLLGLFETPVRDVELVLDPGGLLATELELEIDNLALAANEANDFAELFDVAGGTARIAVSWGHRGAGRPGLGVLLLKTSGLGAD